MHIIGLMSGTSMDGIDAAIVSIGRTGVAPELRLVAYTCTPYETALRRRLEAAAGGERLTALELGELDVRVGEAFASAALALLADHAASGNDAAAPAVELIGSHGQTIAHAPRSGVTVQIGEAAVIAERTGLPVVSDFRVRDLAAGGEGAPLAPFLDRATLVDPERTVGALNVGGIANLTVLRPGGADPVVAFDTGPGNMVIDALIERISEGSQPFDRDGARAARGRVDPALLAMALEHPYFHAAPPKTAGREEFGAQYARRLWDEARSRRLADDDLLATVTAITIESVAAAVEGSGVERLLVSGGGVHNQTILAGLRARLPSVEVTSTSVAGMDPDAKEAMLVATLAWAFVERVPSSLPSVTGARGARILGKLTR